MGGFDAKNKDKILSAFRCTVCLLILREPVQLICGHRQCKSCIKNSNGNFIICPQCQGKSMTKDIVLDKGCKNDMQNIYIDCCLCDWNGIFSEYESHLESTHPSPTCQYCGRSFNSLDCLNIHVQKECDLVTVPCSLKEFGCLEHIIRNQAEKHYLTVQHQQAIIKSLNSRSIMKDVNMTSTLEQDVYENMEVLVGSIEALVSDTQHFQEKSLKLKSDTEKITQKVEELKSSVEEDHSFFKGIESNQTILLQDFASMKNQIEDMQSISYDGICIWRITSFREKLRDAQSERHTSIYSPPFYSSPTGYKMRARLYLNGDGNARGTHMSLFFVLMRSNYDSVLKFPFDYKVTFCMYDQTSSQRHIIDSFQPDIRSTSFQRPNSDMNIASGIPKFFPLSMIERENNPYVQNDTMFIKIMVDFAALPKTLLPFALTLNPAIPTNIQQDMIKKEYERRNQQVSVTTNVVSEKMH